MSTRVATPATRGAIAERLWVAARVEFSMRGYHGARVQSIARRAGCNVALLYRHWNSKKALYLALLRSVWESTGTAVAVPGAAHGAEGVVRAYLDAMLADPGGAQILVREYLDGAPFLAQLVAAEPVLVDPVRRAAQALAHANGNALRSGVDPMLAALTIGGLSALCASAHESSRSFVEVPVGADVWHRHVVDILLHGLLPRREANPR